MNTKQLDKKPIFKNFHLLHEIYSFRLKILIKLEYSAIQFSTNSKQQSE